MPDRSVSVDLQKFIAQHVHSVEQMEILCALCDGEEKSCSVAEVFRQVQSSEKSVSDCLKKLAANGIVTQQTDGAYHLIADKLPLVRELAEAYRKRRVTIIEMIYKPTAPIEDFAEAFRLKKRNNMPQIVYLLCAATSVACAFLLFRRYMLTRGPLLFWSTWCFVCFALTNILLFVDLVVLPGVDLSILRSSLSFAGMMMLLYGLVRQST